MSKGPFLRKYGVEATFNFDLFEIDGVDFRIDAAHASGDTKIMKDEGAEANTTNGFVDEGQGYSITLTATEMQAARIKVYMVDTATKVWLDTSISIETYGHASAMHAFDLDAATVNLSATGLDAIASTATGMVEIAKAIWDRALTGATHNIATSAGRRLRQLTGIVYSDGTAQTGTGNTITLAAGEFAIDDIYNQAYISIVAGTGAGQGHHILSYNGTTKVAVTDDDWFITPDNTSEYVIYGSGSHDETSTGLAQAGSSNTITLQSTAFLTDNIFKGNVVNIASGTGAGQTRRITAYNGTTKVATVSRDWVVNPDATSGYMIYITGDATIDDINSVTSAALVAEIWDRIISKANHNIGQSAAKILRQSGDLVQIDGEVSDTTPSVSNFDTNLTQAITYFEDAVLVFSNGAANAGIGRPVSAYSNVNGNMTFAAPDDWPVTPVNGDDFIIYATHVHPVAQIADAVADEALSGHTTAGTLGKALIDTEAVLTDSHAEAGQGAPPATATFKQMIQYLYKAWRNRSTQTASQYSLYNDDAVTVDQKAVVSDDDTTFDRKEIGSGP